MIRLCFALAHASALSGIPNLMLCVQGTRRYGSDESEPIDWIVPPFSSSKPGSSITSVGLSEMFAYHATTMANTVKSSLLVFSRKVGPTTQEVMGMVASEVDGEAEHCSFSLHSAVGLGNIKGCQTAKLSKVGQGHRRLLW